MSNLTETTMHCADLKPGAVFYFTSRPRKTYRLIAADWDPPGRFGRLRVVNTRGGLPMWAPVDARREVVLIGYTKEVQP